MVDTAYPLTDSLTEAQTFGRYKLVALLGKGGTARVYRAERILRGKPSKPIALKIVSPSQIDNPHVEQAFLTEARLGNVLHHPNLVRIFDHGQEEGQFYLAMELVDGLTLQQALDIGESIPPRVVRDIACAMCKGLEAIHELAIEEQLVHLVHRDIKPSNILLGWDGQIKVADMGIAKGALLSSHNTQLGTVRGTPSFMSPEQAKGQDLDGRSDLFAFGAVLYEMLTGHRLFHGRTMASVLLAVIGADERIERDSFRKSLSSHPGLGEILSRCLRVHRDERFDSARAVRAALESLSFPEEDTDLQVWLGEIFRSWGTAVHDVHATPTMAVTLNPASPSTELHKHPAAEQWLDTLTNPETAADAARLLDKLDAFVADKTSEDARQIAQKYRSRIPSLKLNTPGNPNSPAILACPSTGQLWQGGQRLLKMRTRALPWRLLYYLIRNRGQAREVIYPAVWENIYRPPSSDNALYVSLHRLRKRLAKTSLNIDADDDGAYHVRGDPPLWLWDPTATRQASQGPSGQPTPENNIPAASDRFFGRTEDLAKLATLVADGRRFITVRGPPGTGKTRLVLEFARQSFESANQSLFFCDLTPCQNLSGVLYGIATTLEVSLTDEQDESAILARLGDALKERGPLLLLLDNAEQVRDAVGLAIEQWLEQAPQTNFMVTSRVSLGRSKEQQFPLEPLTPPESSDFDAIASNHAVELFISRAQLVRPDFKVTPDNAAAIHTIISQLDGMPLAIELAASRIRLMSPDTLVKRLDRRFQLLQRASAQERNRRTTLRAALDDSWDLLAPWEQGVLAQCAVFHGGFTLEAAEQVLDLSPWPKAPWILDILDSLLDHSLLTTSQAHSEPRFTMYRSIHAYAEEKLQEMEDVGAQIGRRHAMHYATLGSGERMDAADLHPSRSQWQELRDELDNLLAAIHRGVEQVWPDPAAGACMAAMRILMHTGPHVKGLQLSQQVLALSPSQPIKSRLFYQTGGFFALTGQAEEALAHYTEALDLASKTDQRRLQITIHTQVGFVHKAQGRNDQALASYQKAMDLHAVVDGGKWAGPLLNNLAVLYETQGHLDEALAHYEKALALTRETGNHRDEALLLGNLAGLYHQHLGRPDQALEALHAALEIQRREGYRRHESVVLGNLGDFHMLEGPLEKAEEYLLQAIAIGDEVFPAVAAAFRGSLAVIRAQESKFDESRALLRQGADVLRGLRIIEYGKLICKRAHVELLANEPEAARVAFAEVEALAQGLSLTPQSDLMVSIAKVREQLPD